jgi:hypothetical protein
MPLYDLPLSGRVKGEVGVTVNADYVLAVDMMSDVAGLPVTVYYRVVGGAGQLYDGVQVITTDGLAALQQTLFPLPDGIITGVSIGIPGGLGATGEVRCRIGFDTRGGDHAFAPLLIDGYVGGGHYLQWPVGQPNQIASDRGKIVELVGAVAVAGADATLTIGANAVIEPIRLYTGIACDANIANRRMLITATYGGAGAVIPVIASSSTHAAGATVEHTYYSNPGINQINYTTGILGGMGTNMLPGGSVISTAVINIQVGDVVTPITLDGWRRFEF